MKEKQTEVARKAEQAGEKKSSSEQTNHQRDGGGARDINQ